MTAEQLEKLLEKVTQGEWRVAGKATGYIVSNSESVVIAVVGDYRDDEILPFNKERWDADCALFALAPSLARRVLAAEKLVEALEKIEDVCRKPQVEERDFCRVIAIKRKALIAYREASK